MLNTPRALKSFLILAPHPKSLRQIGEPLVFRNELRKRVRTFHGRFVYCGNGEGDRSIGGANLRKGHSPFNGRHASCPLHPKSLRQIGEPLVFRNELRKRVRTFHGRFVYCGNGEGDRSIGGANLRKGHSPFNGRHASCPLYWKLALYRLLLLAQKKLYKTFEWDSILTQFSFSRQPSNKTRHVRYRTKSKRDNRKPAQCQ